MKTTSVKQAPKGEYLRIGKTTTVYIKGNYDRTSKRYELVKSEDVNSLRYVKGTAACTIGFDF